MSSLIIQVTTVSNVRPHPNADKLDIAEVLGWQVVTGKGNLTAGQKVVYFPPNTVLSRATSDLMGVTKYLADEPGGGGRPAGGRIRCIKLRGEPSFGLAIAPDDPNWEVGTDVAAYYGATKYDPPIRPSGGDAAPDHPYFMAYTDIEDLRNFPGVIMDGEEVVITEKIDGTNCRIGVIEGEFMAGSKRIMRKQPSEEHVKSNLYWYPLSMNGVRDLLVDLSEEHGQAILFGETYGKVQALRYGLDGINFVAFDIMVDGKYLDYDEFRHLCKIHGIPTAPLLARRGFDIQEVRKISSGQSVLGRMEHDMEGVVVRPVKERADPRIGRVILKYISDEAFLGKEKSDVKDE